MSRWDDRYIGFVEHPRYGRGPRLTGLNPDPLDDEVVLHWNATTHEEVVARFEAATGKEWPYCDFGESREEIRRIPETAIPADPSRQALPTVPVTHYFDLERRCRDCKRQFIFFAEEQQYWYEQLGFGLESDCVRCTDCRRQHQAIQRQRKTYESLVHVEDRDEQQILTMAEACLALIEEQVFTDRQKERVRMLLNRIPEDSAIRLRPQYSEMERRLKEHDRRRADSPGQGDGEGSD